MTRAKFRSFYGALARAGGNLPPLDSLTPTGAWSMSRDLLTSFAGSSRFTNASGSVSSLNDQSGNGRNLTQGTVANQPAVATVGARQCADFDGSNDNLAGAALSSFITSSAGYVIVSFLPDTIVTNNANLWTNHGLITDGAAGIFGLYLRNTDATVGNPDTVDAFNWDGASKAASAASVIAGTPYVVEWKRSGGTTVSVRVNGGSWTDVAAGNLTSLTGTITFGTGNGTASGSFDGKIFEAATFTAAPANADAIAANFKAWIGA